MGWNAISGWPEFTDPRHVRKRNYIGDDVRLVPTTFLAWNQFGIRTIGMPVMSRILETSDRGRPSDAERRKAVRITSPPIYT